ncbi:MAG: bifunctional hydroxymethylpyrimidine kinase/phosphomethylpyrimidine kinase [Dysgonamonadaceae bacterium]|nr:bifunctional hydroxymethylpyrimidine kinase/phosphomethylpyrimidine kinase [Dysgonamonadaceae bacterium]
MSNIKRYPTALTIAGSDSGGCAGIQADLKTFSAIGVFGTSAITSVTAQNTQEVRAIETLTPSIVQQQMEAVLDDMTVDAVKTGMLPSPEIIETIAATIDRYRLKNVIVDPVMVATSGARLTETSIGKAFREELYRRLTLITPNIPEAEALSGISISSKDDFQAAAEVLLQQGCSAVLIKGGHLPSTHAVDILFRQNEAPLTFSAPHTDSINLHGTGCTFSSAIAAYLALGQDLESAIRAAKIFITSAIQHGNDIVTGRGYGPVNHFFDPQRLTGKQITKITKEI